MDWDRLKSPLGRVATIVVLTLVIGPSLRSWMSIPGADYTIAEMDRYQGRYDLAIDKYNALIRSDPNDARYYAGRGDTFRRKGDRARAFADFDTALAHDPHSFETYLFRCQAHRDA